MTAETVVPPSGPAAPAARRYAAAAVLAVGLGALHLRHRPPTLCLLRALTGIPCPFCGGTTAVVDLGHGSLRSALAASPVALGLLTIGPMLSVVSGPRWWHARRTRWLVIAAVVIGSELWQLARFGVIS